MIDEMQQYEIRKLKREEEAYPLRMKKLSGMPKVLYNRGTMVRDDCPSVAIVGARTCSSYGRNLAREFARVLSNEGVQIISGLALGIDGEAHAGALKGGTPTYAVLACGIEQCYPRSHRMLYRNILEQGGGILGEQPEGMPPCANHFPARNRIISGLADVVLVIEAKVRSGALITVEFALEQGKTVFALPGRVGDALSEGCHRLIAQGAGIAYSPQVILEELRIERKQDERQPLGVMAELSPEARELYQCMESYPTSLQQLKERLSWDISAVMMALFELEAGGMAQEVGKNYYVRKVTGV